MVTKVTFVHKKRDLAPIREWKMAHGSKSVMFDESWNIVKLSNGRSWGSGCYAGIIFACSKCGKTYCTYGALKHYHKKCTTKKGVLQ